MDPYALDEVALATTALRILRDLVSTLGGKVNLGGTHANAVCALAGHEPNSSPAEADVPAVFAALSQLLDDLTTTSDAHLMLKLLDDDPEDWQAHMECRNRPKPINGQPSEQ